LAPLLFSRPDFIIISMYVYMQFASGCQPERPASLRAAKRSLERCAGEGAYCGPRMHPKILADRAVSEPAMAAEEFVILEVF